ncbi:MAG TPA: CatA-like O-acetyltransferase [Oculatellaceae cyanobacterium]|jgi:chloramphenicol O-acetyltransferase
MPIPAKYEPELINDLSKEGWFEWFLDYFTDPNVLQVPYLDLTIQLDVTDAYAIYQDSQVSGSTFFGFLLWHLVQTLRSHTSFNMRFVENNWYILNNPPIFIPVAVGGKQRFWNLVIESVVNTSYEDFIDIYRFRLNQARNCQTERIDAQTYSLAYCIGNLPNLQFSALTLHWHLNAMIGQPFFYFGKRYFLENRFLIPFAAKLHHACADPFVFDLLVRDLQARFS